MSTNLLHSLSPGTASKMQQSRELECSINNLCANRLHSVKVVQYADHWRFMPDEYIIAVFFAAQIRT